MRETFDRRPQMAALGGFVIQAAILVVLALLAHYGNSDALAACVRYAVAGLPIWLVLYLVFKQMGRVYTESLESAEIRKAQEAGITSAVFEADDEALLIEQNRLRWFVRWLLPGVTIAVAAYLIIGNFVGWGWEFDSAFGAPAEGGLQRTDHPTFLMWFVVGAGFVGFLYARYTVGLARLREWRLLHAGASFMAGNAFLCLLLVIALAGSGQISWLEPLVAYIVRIALLVLGIEFALNYVLDLYRPRTPGTIARPAFDSRLLGMITEPGSIAKSIAEAVNYQFGFEVSKTWFYRLLQKWLLPLIVTSALVIVGLTSLVAIDASEQGVVERFGKPLRGVVLSPGVHVKLPWPIDIVRKESVRKIHHFVIGEAEQDTHDGEHEEAVLWTEQHKATPELMLMVASPGESVQADRTAAPPAERTASDATASVATSLLMVSVPVNYRIKDLDAYLYEYADPEKLLECTAYRYLSEYAASVDTDTLMGPGRVDFNRRLHEILQAELDRLNLGVELVFVGIHSAHPPAQDEVAKAFQEVIAQETRKGQEISAAYGMEQELLTTVVGTVERARTLDAAIQQRRAILDNPNSTPEEIAAARDAVDDLMLGNPARGIESASGEVATVLAYARRRATELVSEAIAKVRGFTPESAAYRASPELYKIRKWLDIFRDPRFKSIRKFLIVGDPEDILVEYTTGEQHTLDTILEQAVEERTHGG